MGYSEGFQLSGEWYGICKKIRGHCGPEVLEKVVLEPKVLEVSLQNREQGRDHSRSNGGGDLNENLGVGGGHTGNPDC